MVLDSVLEFGEDRFPSGLILSDFLKVAANDVPASVEEHLFDFQIVFHFLVAAPAGKDLLPNLLVLAQLAAYDVVKGVCLPGVQGRRRPTARPGDDVKLRLVKERNV